MQRSSIVVLEPAASQDLVDLATVKAYFQISGTDQDEQLQTLITFGSKVIADLCDRVFGLEKVTETINISVSSSLYDVADVVTDVSILLARYPVVEIESVEVDGTPVTDYLLDVDSGTLRGLLAGETVITYSGGYDLPYNAPGALSFAVMDVIKQNVSGAATRDPYVMMVTDNTVGSVRYFPQPGVPYSIRAATSGAQGGTRAGLSSQAMSMLEPYKRPALA